MRNCAVKLTYSQAEALHAILESERVMTEDAKHHQQCAEMLERLKAAKREGFTHTYRKPDWSAKK